MVPSKACSSISFKQQISPSIVRGPKWNRDKFDKEKDNVHKQEQREEWVYAEWGDAKWEQRVNKKVIQILS